MAVDVLFTSLIRLEQMRQDIIRIAEKKHRWNHFNVNIVKNVGMKNIVGHRDETMKRDVYVFNDGTLSRKDNTLLLTIDEKKHYIPVETVEAYIFW